MIISQLFCQSLYRILYLFSHRINITLVKLHHQQEIYPQTAEFQEDLKIVLLEAIFLERRSQMERNHQTG